MTSFTIQQFQGSIPRLADHLGTKGTAAEAIDCKLESGNLDSFREPKFIRDLGEATRTVLHQCCWHDFKGCVDVAYGSVNCKEIFVTGLREYPVQISVNDDCEVTETRLGMPCPTRAPSVVVGDVSDTTDEDYEGRTYSYQYVSSLGWRSQLSPGSRAQNLKDGQICIISGWTKPDPSWDVVSVAIYRSVTGHQSGREPGNTPDTVWMLVAEIDIDEVAYTDTNRNEDLFTAVEEDVVLPPPEGLRGITWVESSNCLFGFVGNRIYASENHNYYNWPYYYDLDDNVCGIVESGGAIYVATDGHPYILNAVADCKHAGCRDILRLPGAFPMVGCGNQRMAACSVGAVYPSHKGLVILTGRKAPKYLTLELYTDEDWQILMPQTVTPIEVGGKLYVFAQNGAFCMSLAFGAEKDSIVQSHTSLSDRGVTDAFVTRQGDFYIVKDHKLYQWDRGEQIRPHVFTSVGLLTPSPIGWASGRLDFQYGKENVKIVCDGRTVLDREIISTREFRLPMHAIGTETYCTISGTGRVKRFSIATSVSELNK